MQFLFCLYSIKSPVTNEVISVNLLINKLLNEKNFIDFLIILI